MAAYAFTIWSRYAFQTAIEQRYAQFLRIMDHHCSASLLNTWRGATCGYLSPNVYRDVKMFKA
jgi:hypothetical protein